MLEMGMLTRFSCVSVLECEEESAIKSPKAYMRDVVIFTPSGVERQAGE